MASVDMEWIPFHQPLRHPSQTSAFSQWKEMNFFPCQYANGGETLRQWLVVMHIRFEPQFHLLEIQVVRLHKLASHGKCADPTFDFAAALPSSTFTNTSQLPHLLGLGTSPVGIFCWTPLASHAKAILAFLNTKKQKSPIQILTSLIENKNHPQKNKITKKKSP